MKKLFLILALLLNNFLFAQSAEIKTEHIVLDTNKVISPEPNQSVICKYITRLLSHYHYKRVVLNDSLSSEIFDNYLRNLDYNRIYLLKSDVDKFEKYRYSFDEDLLFGDIDPAFEIFNKFKTRVNERIRYINTLLKKEFDYTINEEYVPDRKDSPWAKTESELNEIWRKKIKNEALSMKLSGKDWEKTSDVLLKRYQNFQKAVLQYNSGDVFQIFMNTYSDVMDPHTSYLSQRTSDNFDISMKLSLEGIGAQLRTENDYTKVVDVIPGGPAAKAGELQPNDLIAGVGQGNDGEIVDVIGWRIDDVVSLIRGKKGTLVRLLILKSDAGIDAPADTISIVRDKVKLEEQAAKSEVFEINQNDKNYRIGVLSIPSFYIDFEARSKGDPDYRSTTRDVRKLLSELQEKKVDGVIIDLRDNGGGALQEAVDLTGLFIKDGPVVQVRGIDNRVDVEKDEDPEVYYNGPLIVMVNKFSASASEIFSGAIQDYGRGLVIGEQTYGKGTVQNLIDLDRVIPNEQDAGKLKLTIAKYYRINGSSTQNLGVIPDITYPSTMDAHDFGESSNKSALPWDQIKTTVYSRYDNFSGIIPELEKRHEARIKKNPEFQYILEDIEEYNSRKSKNSYSLNYEVRKNERDKAEEKKKERQKERDKYSEISVKQKGEITIKNLKVDDPYLEESGHILADFIQKKAG